VNINALHDSMGTAAAPADQGEFSMIRRDAAAEIGWAPRTRLA